MSVEAVNGYLLSTKNSRGQANTFFSFFFNFYLYLLKIGALVSKEYNAPLGGI